MNFREKKNRQKTAKSSHEKEREKKREKIQNEKAFHNSIFKRKSYCFGYVMFFFSLGVTFFMNDPFKIFFLYLQNSMFHFLFYFVSIFGFLV